MRAGQPDVSDRADDTEKPESDTFGGRIARAREAQGLSLEQAARRLGVKSATLKSWESDRSAPRANRLAMLAGILGVSPSWILTGQGRGPVGSTVSNEIQSIRAGMLRLKDELNDLQDQMEVLAMRLHDYQAEVSETS